MFTGALCGLARSVGFHGMRVHLSLLKLSACNHSSLLMFSHQTPCVESHTLEVDSFTMDMPSGTLYKTTHSLIQVHHVHESSTCPTDKALAELDSNTLVLIPSI
eukprot:scpid97302/ scgid23558/ 